ncbi:hypothetical protein LQK89_02595 [Curtobacterium sp. C1]|uniref:hypothetical protein n=1 Tax=Curtobacterium sp. C1 TaxID=2898151 RepID=UPI001E2FF767|nr:hypothetical protein [Curtobacterium sp. C1]UFU14607.1 hypothetical protein LQK89_02595 [Curtobacterium sp. C1]
MTGDEHPVDEHDVAWANFVASLDPVALQRELARPGDLNAERFGSREHHEMVQAHDWLKRDRAATAAMTEAERLQRRHDRQEADANLTIARHPQPVVVPETARERSDIEAAIRTYSQRQAAAAAERTAA